MTRTPRKNAPPLAKQLGLTDLDKNISATIGQMHWDTLMPSPELGIKMIEVKADLIRAKEKLAWIVNKL